MCMPVCLCLSQKPATRRPDHKYWRTLALQSAFQANQHKLKQDGLAYPELARSSSDSETLLLDFVSSTYGQTLEYRIGRGDIPGTATVTVSPGNATATHSPTPSLLSCRLLPISFRKRAKSVRARYRDDGALFSCWQHPQGSRAMVKAATIIRNSKSHQYTCSTHTTGCRCKKERTLIIARVALGDPYVLQQLAPESGAIV